MTLNLMPAELVAKIAQDSLLDSFGWPPGHEEAADVLVDTVRHAWIVAAEWHEDEAALQDEIERHADRHLMTHEADRARIAARVHRAAARALRQAAREDVEP